MKTKAENIALLVQEKQLPPLIKAALEGDINKAVALLSRGEATMEDQDADGKTVMDYANALGLWHFLGRIASFMPQEVAGKPITETANLVACMCEGRELFPPLVHNVPWDILVSLKLEGNIGTNSAHEALSWIDGFGQCVLAGVASGCWKPDETMLKHLKRDEGSELMGFARDQTIFAHRYGIATSIVDDTSVSVFGEVKEMFGAYEHLQADPYVIVSDHAGGLTVVYGYFDVELGDPFFLAGNGEYRSSESTAYAW